MFKIDTSESVNVCIDYIENLFKRGKKQVIVENECFLNIIRKKPLKKRFRKYYISLIRINGIVYWIVEKNGICYLEKSKYK